MLKSCHLEVVTREKPLSSQPAGPSSTAISRLAERKQTLWGVTKSLYKDLGKKSELECKERC